MKARTSGPLTFGRELRGAQRQVQPLLFSLIAPHQECGLGAFHGHHVGRNIRGGLKALDGALIIGKLDRFGVGKHGIALLHAGVVGHDVVEPIAHAGNLGLLARLRVARGALSPIEAVLAAAGAHQVRIRIREVLLLSFQLG